jgi:Zn-finger nucleic acid-binding protein
MRCPRCKGTTALSPIAKKNVEFMGCRTCKGILLQKESLLEFLRAASPKIGAAPASGPARDYFNQLVTASEFVRTNKASMSCPSCRYDMYETENRGVHLDFCMNCQAVWFDSGELQLIMQRLRKGESFTLVPLPLQEGDHASGLILQILRDEWL